MNDIDITASFDIFKRVNLVGSVSTVQRNVVPIVLTSYVTTDMVIVHVDVCLDGWGITALKVKTILTFHMCTIKGEYNEQ